MPLMQNIINQKSPELPKINEVKSLPNVKTLEEIENELLNQPTNNKNLNSSNANSNNTINRSQTISSLSNKSINNNNNGNNSHLQSLQNTKTKLDSNGNIFKASVNVFLHIFLPQIILYLNLRRKLDQQHSKSV
jgi:hypothetical protein